MSKKKTPNKSSKQKKTTMVRTEPNNAYLFLLKYPVNIVKILIIIDSILKKTMLYSKFK